MKRCCQKSRVTPFWCLAVVPVLFFYFLMSPAYAGLLDGKPAPAFELKDHAGKSCSLNDFEGKPLVMKIGTTWCPSCGSQSNELVKALPKLRELEVAVVEVFVEDSPQAVKEYRASHKFPEDIRTCIDQDGQVLGGYSVVSIPRVIMIDPGHQVISDQYLVPARRIEEVFSKIKE